MGATSIQWCDHSINPIRARLNGRVGHHCAKISPGCKHCYSSRLQPRFGLPMFQEQRRLDVKTFLDVSKLEEVLRRKKPTKYFWCDMTDMFGEWVPDEMIAACFGVMAATPHHTHQVLTKRADRLPQFFASEWGNELKMQHAAYRALQTLGLESRFPLHPIKDTFLRYAWPLQNVWLGVSCEDQQRADERIPRLLETPAAVRFVSAEPLLGPVDLRVYLREHACDEWPKERARGLDGCSAHPMPPLSWVIVGGESGNGARPCDVGWISSIVKQCLDANVPVFTKQLGADPVEQELGAKGLVLRMHHYRFKDRKGGDPSEWPGGLARLNVRQFPDVRI